MRIYRIAQLETGRRHGKTLPETGYEYRLVRIYRAVNATVMAIKYMDYITLSLKFAKGHADHMAVAEEDDQVVLSAIVEASKVAEASNPGEYFYIGKEDVTGNAIYNAEAFNYENL